jgi:hypothetical protein
MFSHGIRPDFRNPGSVAWPASRNLLLSGQPPSSAAAEQCEPVVHALLEHGERRCRKRRVSKGTNHDGEVLLAPFYGVVHDSQLPSSPTRR